MEKSKSVTGGKQKMRKSCIIRAIHPSERAFVDDERDPLHWHWVTRERGGVADGHWRHRRRQQQCHGRQLANSTASLRLQCRSV